MTKLGQRDVFVDLCVQKAYLHELSSQRCRNAQQVTHSVKHVMAFARLAKVPVLSCLDTCCGNRIGNGFVSVAADGRPREQKTAFTLMPRHIIFESDNSLCVPLDVLYHFQQAVFTKVHRDPFTNPKFDRLLTEMPARRFVVFGIPLETSLRMLVLGLLRRKRRVVVLEDACGYWNRQEADMVLRQLDVKGCEITVTNEYLAQAFARLLPRARIRPSRSVA